MIRAIHSARREFETRNSKLETSSKFEVRNARCAVTGAFSSVSAFALVSDFVLRASDFSARIVRPCAVLALAAGLVLAGTGCKLRRAMYDQPKVRPLAHTDFFGDSRSARAQVEGTIARGQLREDTHLYQGTVNGKPAETFPFPVTREVLLRGQERFNIYCAPCHDRSGSGQGMVVRRGFKQPPSYHIDRLRQSPPGYFYATITGGFGQMPSYAEQIRPADRWAIVAYVRALQLSQHAAPADVPETERASLEAGN
jgi:hypothetical protein